MLQRGEERRDRLAHLEVDGPMLDLDDDVRLEGAVERVEVVIAGASAIGLEVVPVEVIVVDEAAIEHDSAVRFEGACDCVRGLCGRASVFGWPDAAFGVGLDDEAAEVGNQLVDLIYLLLPPRRDLRVYGIEGCEAADDLRAGEIDGERHAHSPWAECVCDARQLMQHRWIERAQVGVYVVDRASVEPDRSEQAAVLRYAREVLPDVPVGEEDGASCVAAFDCSVEVIPLVYPANRRGGRFGVVGEWMLLRRFVRVDERLRRARLGYLCQR